MAMGTATFATNLLSPARAQPLWGEQHHDESESSTVERHTTTPPAAIVKEWTTNSVETQEKN
jgi:hypothetical protein